METRGVFSPEQGQELSEFVIIQSEPPQPLWEEDLFEITEQGQNQLLNLQERN